MKIGIIGGGQLAQMLAQAACSLGFEVICLEPQENCPASRVAKIIVGNYDDPQKLSQLAAQVDVITFEFENIEPKALINLSEKVAIYPSPQALEVSQDRWLEKNFFASLAIPTTQFFKVDSLAELKAAVDSIGLPAIVKTRRLGYDGKGQYILREASDITQAWNLLQTQSLLVENLIAFDKEVSIVAVRNVRGETLFYPLTQNQHEQGILRLSTVPKMAASIIAKAQDYALRVMTAFNYVGVLAIEFFQKDDELYVNEMAPRVHNSGHWTIEGAQTSQFENHLRAIADLPLGASDSRGYCAMVNLIGEVPALSELLKIKTAHCHIYGKAPRARRKLGHVSLCEKDEVSFNTALNDIKKIVKFS